MNRNRDPFATAVAALNRRAHSVAEIRERLEARDFSAEEVAETIERLSNLGELDDESYARLFAGDKRDLSGWGPERIAAALGDRGVPEQAIDLALADDRGEDQVERAGALLSRRGHDCQDAPDRSRALGFLTRRGYSYETAYEAIGRLERRIQA